MVINRILLLIFFTTQYSAIFAQSELELRTDGIVVPRITPTEIMSPVKGMLIYDTDIDGFKYYNGNSWLTIGGGTGGSVAWSDITNIPSGFADNTDNVISQTISKSGSIVTLSNRGGSFTDDVDDADADPSNELQSLTLSNDEIGLSGSSRTIPIEDISPWTIASGNALKFIGQVGLGINIPLAKLDIVSKAGEDGLRVRIDGDTKLRVLANSGTTIGSNPGDAPINGLYVHGNTGLGTTSATEKLEIVGAINLRGNASSSNPAAGTLRWNAITVDFEGYDGSVWKSLTGFPSSPPPYQVGDYEDNGVVFWVSSDGKEVKFVYVAELSNQKWSTPSNVSIDGADSNIDGLNNSLDMDFATNLTLNAAKDALNLVAGGQSEWYLPAINELVQLVEVKSIINPVLVANLGDEISGVYWSSTQHNSTEAKSVSTSTGNAQNTDKNLAGLVRRAIRTVTFP